MTLWTEVLNDFGRWLYTHLWPLSIELAILALAVPVVLYLLRLKSPGLRYLFWGLVLIKPLVSFFVASPVSLYPAMLPRQEVDRVAVVREYDVFPERREGVVAASEANAAIAVGREIDLDRYGMIGLAWLVVVGLWGLRFVSGCSLVLFLRKTATIQLEGPLHTALDEAARTCGLRRKVSVAVSELVHGPVLTGILRPVIIFPRRMTTALSAEQLKLIFLHELAHVRRIDNLALFLQRAVEMLLFFHPAVWICGRMMRREAERACDDAVVTATGRHLQYADGLARVAEARQELTGRLLVNAFAAAESDLSTRVRRILDKRIVPTSVRSRVLALVGLGLFAFLGLPMAIAQDGREKKAETEIRGVVTFADPQLEAVIREVVGKPEGELLAIDVRRIFVLHAPGQKIERLDGIEHLTMAQTLDFRENEIEDLSPLAHLKHLRRLFLSQNRIREIGALKEVVALTKLYLDRNEIDDIAPLAGLGELEILRLDWNRIGNISPLAKLFALRWLRLDVNRITDIAPLATLVHLQAVGLTGNRIDDISALVDNSGMGAGAIVNLSDNPLGRKAIEEDWPALVQRGVAEGEIQPILTGSGEFMDEISFFLLDNEVREQEPYFFRHDELTSMVVNPAGTNAERFMMFSVQLEIGNVATVAEAKEVDAQLGQYASLIKATLTEVMRAKTIEQIQQDPGFKKIRREMQEALQVKVMGRIGKREGGRGKIEIRGVVISDLIIQ